MTTLYLVRHGETFDNANQIMQGQTQGMLNENGIRQAKELCLQLADKHFDVIVSSDLNRAIQTAKIVTGLNDKDIKTTPLLRERDWGGFTGRYIPDLKGEKWPDDIESLDVLLNRANDFLNFIQDRFPNKQVLAVGHGIINKAIQAVYYGKQMSDIPRMSNCEIRILTL
jgi:probable phosphoglycerate mutase